MKRTFVLVFTLLIVNIVFAQFNTMFNDTLRPFGDGAYTNRTICQNDSFYYVGGVFNNGETNSVNQYYILKLDEQGNLIKKNSYSDTILNYHSTPYNSMIIDGGKIVSCIITENVTQYEVKSKIITIDKISLDTLWTKTYLHPDTANILSSSDKFSELTSIKSTADNNFILAGNYMKAGSLISYLMKIDNLGNELWTTTYDNYSGFLSIDIAEDSSFYIPCSKNNSMYLINIDKDGVYKWEININMNSNPSYPVSVSVMNNNSVIVSSAYWYDLTNSLRGVTLSKINTVNKSISWESNFILFKNLTCITLHQAMGVETLADGNIVVSGTLIENGSYKGFIFKLTSNGDSLWTKTYVYGNPNYNDGQLNDLLVCDDGGFLGVGYIWPTNANNAAWLFKTDSNGTIGWDTSTPLSDQEMKIWPNPAKSFINIEFNQSLIKSAQLLVYNSLGQLVLQKKLSKGEKNIKLKLEGLKSGVYFIEVRNTDGVFGGGKLVVE